MLTLRMDGQTRDADSPRSRHTGFTLIELLTVIAIIAILAAILFPVFAKVREKGRQTTMISNMQQIQTAMGQFKLDNRQYPTVLFGYAYPAAAPLPMDKAYAQAQVDGQQNIKNFFPGLYPQYVKDVRVFEDPDNPDDKLGDVTPPVQINVLSNNILTPTNVTFYKADAMDISPQISGSNDTWVKSGSDYVYVPRYQPSWTDINTAFDKIDPVTGRNDYQRQLRWRTVPGDTYVTASTWHVPQAGKVIVLFESGGVKTWDVSQFLVNGPDSATVAASGGQSQATFWKDSPNGK